jgi:large subunit ribosomal protein L14e
MICIVSHSYGGFGVPALEVGRICAKLSGREAGRKCVVVDVTDKSFVLITGPKEVTGVRRRRANVNHIEPLQDSVEIKRGATDEEVTEALKAAGKLEAMAQSIKPVSP